MIRQAHPAVAARHLEGVGKFVIFHMTPVIIGLNFWTLFRASSIAKRGHRVLIILQHSCRPSGLVGNLHTLLVRKS